MSPTIIAIDDEPHNLLLIEAYLTGRGYAARYFSGANAAMEYLRAGGVADAVLLDRMMPEVDGLTFMHAFRQLKQFAQVPVILQSAAASPAEIAEGIDAGAYYYLTKPFSREVMNAVLARALADYAGRQTQDNEAATLRTGMKQLQAATLSFRTLEQARDAASFFALLYPEPDRAVLGLREIMLNAVEHGNLGITYSEKTALVRAAQWEQEVTRRLHLPEHAAKTATARLTRTAEAIVLTVEDQGAGFDWAPYITFDRARARDPHGRGIAMARMVSFDELSYLAPGNNVVCTTRLSARATQLV